MRRVYSFRKTEPKCRRNTISALRHIHSAEIPTIGESIIYRKKKLTILKVFNNPKSGTLVEYTSSNGDVGVCILDHWWDKLLEEKHKAA